MSVKQRKMKREKQKKMMQSNNTMTHLKQESVVFIQTNTLNVSCIHANIQFDKLKLRKY